MGKASGWNPVQPDKARKNSIKILEKKNQPDPFRLNKTVRMDPLTYPFLKMCPVTKVRRPGTFIKKETTENRMRINKETEPSKGRWKKNFINDIFLDEYGIGE